MKTQRRHQLESNTLAKELTLWGDKLRPYSGIITGAIGLLVGAYVVWTFWESYRSSKAVSAWDEYQLAVMEGDGEYKQVQRAATNDDYGGVEMQEWAFVAWADRQLRIAAEQYLVDRDGATKRLTDVAGVYEQLAEAATAPEVRNRARFGLARVNEMLDRLDDARRQYGLVEGPLGELARERVKELDAKPSQEACQWLATAKLPKPVPPKGPGTPGSKPAFEAQPPAASANGTPFDSSKSLEEILGGLEGEKDKDKDKVPGRYGDQGEAPPAAPPPAGGPTTAAPPATSAPAPSSSDSLPPADSKAKSGAPAEK